MLTLPDTQLLTRLWCGMVWCAAATLFASLSSATRRCSSLGQFPHFLPPIQESSQSLGPPEKNEGLFG